MGQAHLARPHFQPTADKCGHRCGMMRRAERPDAQQAAVIQRSGHGGDHRHLQRLGRGQFRQYARQARGYQRFACTRRADEQKIVASCRRHLKRALGAFLPLDLGQAGAAGGRIRPHGHGRRHQLGAAKMVEQRQQVKRGQHLDPPRPGRLAALRRRADQAQIVFRRMKRRQQHTRHRGDAAIQPQFAKHQILAQLFGVDHPHRRQQAKRDRQIVVRPFLGQVGGRQVHRDPLRRQRKPQRGKRGVHAVAAFTNGLVGQAHHAEGGNAVRHLHMNVNRAGLQPQKCNGGDMCNHQRRFMFPFGSWPCIGGGIVAAQERI